LVVAVFLMRSDGSSLENAPASEPGKHLKVDVLELGLPWGIRLSTQLTSDTPVRVTGTSLDPRLVADRADGYIWDNNAPDTDMEPEFVDISEGTPVWLNLTVRPRCDLDTDWSRVEITVQTSQGHFVTVADIPQMPTLVTEWCQSPMQVVAGSGGASANWCEVHRDFEFINPGGRAATVELDTPGWKAEPLEFKPGQAEATMVVTADNACDLPKDKTHFTIRYADGATESVTGPNPLQNL
jgi:hypothetical protein